MAKAFTMSGGSGGSDSAIDYTGSYNILPSNYDKTIPSNSRLTQDLTILGDINLQSSNIRKGKNIFNVEGSLNAVENVGGVGTAYLTVDAPIQITKIDETYVEKTIGEVNPIVDSQSPQLRGNDNDEVLSKKIIGNDVYTITLETRDGQTGVIQDYDLLLTFYVNNTRIKQIDNIAQIGYSGTLSQISRTTTVNPETGEIALAIGIITSTTGNDYLYYYQTCDITGDNLTTTSLPSSSNWQKIELQTNYYNNQYITSFMVTSNSSTTFCLYTFDGQKWSNYATIPESVGGNRLIYGEDGNYYIVDPKLYYDASVADWINVTKYSWTNKVYEKGVYQVDLYSGGSKPGYNAEGSILSISIDEDGNVYILYTDTAPNEYSNLGTYTGEVKFNSSFTGAINDVKVLSHGLTTKFGASWLDKRTHSMTYSCLRGVIKVDRLFNMILYYVSSQYTFYISIFKPAYWSEDRILWYGVASDNPFIFYDNSVITTKTITTPTFTATIEEV